MTTEIDANIIGRASFTKLLCATDSGEQSVMATGADEESMVAFEQEPAMPWSQEFTVVSAEGHILPYGARAIHREWPVIYVSTHTSADITPAYGTLDEATQAFVRENGLNESVRWLQSVTPEFFDGAEFEIEALPADEGESEALALRVFGCFSPAEFRERRGNMCRAMLEAGHRTLYKAVGIFQRRMAPSGWQRLSCYGSFSIG